ncbi:hypothetical protein CL654_02335 [bacterium]|nr:hypothetical protein [bacterium]|tara:strand:+ start:15183 stop:15785 length:603 start_codon:yes stop_codon:yes gene_type:complete
MNIPKVEFITQHKLHQMAALYAQEKKWEPLSLEKLQERAEEYKKRWSQVEEKILLGLQDICGLTYKEDTINVYLLPAYKGGFSTPLVTGSYLEPDRYIDILSHELIHRLFSRDKEEYSFFQILKEMYPNKENLVIIHVAVHAVLKALYKDVLNEPSRLERDIEKSQMFPAYKEAWEIVERDGYESIIKKLFPKTKLNIQK